ncbi:MAG: hypothetical protein RDV41_11670 [Planctomycetota bacterium]|nr:hypothetical protein [Planctomycetota bacterium]
MPVPARGVQHIRTHTGKAHCANAPHVAYLRIACLELEKARRCNERESASRRVADIDARVSEIEKDTATIIRDIDHARGKEPGRGARSDRAAAAGGHPGAFKITY